jgi:hypothetical protein
MRSRLSPSALLLLYYYFTTLLLLYCWFPTAFLLLYYCFTIVVLQVQVGLVLSAVLAFRSLAYIRSKLLPGTPLYLLY